MFTKIAYVQGVQRQLHDSGYVAYANEAQAVNEAQKVASVLLIDPAEVEFDLEKCAEVCDALLAVNQGGAEQAKQAAYARLNRAADNVKRAMNEGGDLAASGRNAGGADTNDTAKYDVAGNGDTSTPMGSGSTTGNETKRPAGKHADGRLAPSGENAGGADTNEKAHWDSATGQSSMAQRQTTGDELKVAAAQYGPLLDPSLKDAVKVSAIRQLVTFEDEAECAAFIEHINATYGEKVAETEDVSDDDILGAIAAAAG